MNTLSQARWVTVWTRLAYDFIRLFNGSKYGLVGLNTTLTRFTRHLQGLHTVPPTCVRVMLDFTHSCMFDINWLLLMAWLHNISNFQRRNSYIYNYKNNGRCNRWQNKGIKTHEQIDRHCHIETVNTRTRPWLTILERVWFVLKPYWSYDDRLKTYVDTRVNDFMYCCIYGLMFYKPYTAFTDMYSNGPGVTRFRPRLVWLYVRFTRAANRESRVFCVRLA